MPSAMYCRILLRSVRTDTPSTRAARVRLPSQRQSVCSTSSRSTSPTVAPISNGTISLGASEGAETAGAVTLFLATFLGVPVSTTHTITGAIVGVGAARRVSAVRWNVASSIVYAWVITIPASAIVAALTWWAVQIFVR